MTTAHHHTSAHRFSDSNSPGTKPAPRSALGRVVGSMTGLARTWRRDLSPTIDVRLSAHPDRSSCIVSITGVVDAANARELARSLDTVRGYRFVAIDLSAATFDHPVAQLKFDQICEELEVAGTNVVVSGARDDMRLSR